LKQRPGLSPCMRPLLDLPIRGQEGHAEVRWSEPRADRQLPRSSCLALGSGSRDPEAPSPPRNPITERPFQDSPQTLKCLLVPAHERIRRVVPRPGVPCGASWRFLRPRRRRTPPARGVVPSCCDVPGHRPLGRPRMTPSDESNLRLKRSGWSIGDIAGWTPEGPLLARLGQQRREADPLDGCAVRQRQRTAAGDNLVEPVSS
jgi:hypothetical protein